MVGDHLTCPRNFFISSQNLGPPQRGRQALAPSLVQQQVSTVDSIDKWWEAFWRCGGSSDAEALMLAVRSELDA